MRRPGRPRMSRSWIGGLLLALSLLTANTASAHGVIAAAWPAGDVIEGEIGFSTGNLAPEGTVVRVETADGRALGTTQVEADGLFRFRPTEAVPHRFLADLGQGHVAQIELGVDELPAALAAAAAPATATAATDPGRADAVDVARIEAAVAAAVQRELAPLKRQLAEREGAANLQSIIGGLGYICGIFGLLFFIYARRGRR